MGNIVTRLIRFNSTRCSGQLYTDDDGYYVMHTEPRDYACAKWHTNILREIPHNNNNIIISNRININVLLANKRALLCHLQRPRYELHLNSLSQHIFQWTCTCNWGSSCRRSRRGVWVNWRVEQARDQRCAMIPANKMCAKPQEGARDTNPMKKQPTDSVSFPFSRVFEIRVPQIPYNTVPCHIHQNVRCLNK